MIAHAIGRVKRARAGRPAASLADAEAGKDRVEQVFGGLLARQLAQGAYCRRQVHAQEILGSAGGKALARGPHAGQRTPGSVPLTQGREGSATRGWSPLADDCAV